MGGQYVYMMHVEPWLLTSQVIAIVRHVFATINFPFHLYAINGTKIALSCHRDTGIFVPLTGHGHQGTGGHCSLSTVQTMHIMKEG